MTFPTAAHSYKAMSLCTPKAVLLTTALVQTGTCPLTPPRPPGHNACVGPLNGSLVQLHSAKRCGLVTGGNWCLWDWEDGKEGVSEQLEDYTGSQRRSHSLTIKSNTQMALTST